MGTTDRNPPAPPESRVALPYTFAPLRTARLCVRPMTSADVGDLFVYQSDPDVCRYLPFAPRSREEVTAKVEQFSQALTLAADGDYWQLALEREGRAIGDLFFTIKSARDAQAEIGWTLHPAHHGRGYMTEAASALLDLVFGEIGLHRVSAVLDPRNAPSAALCRRLGMREEAHHLEDLWFKGEWGDTLIYAILDREWAPRRAEESVEL
jgi:RimJ/RimL family protein N-acetyltransferase